MTQYLLFFQQENLAAQQKRWNSCVLEELFIDGKKTAKKFSRKLSSTEGAALCKYKDQKKSDYFIKEMG